MSDTSTAAAAIIEARYRAMSAEDRCRVASSLFDTARAIVDSSLTADLTIEQRRVAIARRLYGAELPDAAYAAHAAFGRASH